MKREPLSFMVHFAKLPDPRIERTRLHSLQDMIAIALCAIISGADGWVAVELWGKSKESWLRTFLELPNGIPSHDTLGRVFAALSPDAFRKCFVAWAQEVAAALKDHVVIDGKTLRRSFDRAGGREAIHMVSAWSRDLRLVLGQLKTDDKSNEITAIPLLLELLDLTGCTVTIDAMGCQKDIAKKIIEKDAAYMLALKANQPGTLLRTETAFVDAQKSDPRVKYSKHSTTDHAHGRVEHRIYECIAAPDVPEFNEWPSLKTLVCVIREREVSGRVTTEAQYYLSSSEANAKCHAAYIRGHWSIENDLHWCLDVQFQEDANRIRKDHGPENAGIIRHLAISLLKQEKTAKVGIQSKRMKAGWDLDYLLTVLRGPRET